jgi:membrane protein insertase Oxa1/YidC/SpoIIIJ
MRTMQKFLPILYASLYLAVPGAVVLYTVVSTAIRIGTQLVLSRRGTDEPPPPAIAA